MQTHTRAAIEALLKGDTTVTPAERCRMLIDAKRERTPDRVISRAEAAKRFGRCARSLDNWVKRGLLKKWQLPGMSRATGFRESEIAALLDTGTGIGRHQAG